MFEIALCGAFGYCQYMSERLKEMIESYFIHAGSNAAAKLSVAVGCSQRLIYSVKNEGHVPAANTIYRLAKACGWKDEEALRLAREEALPAGPRN